MDEERAAGARRISGRRPELAALEAFFAAEPAGRSLVLVGQAGIGKTTLWEAGLDAARRRGLRVLAARPSAAEAQLSFAAMTDLLEDVDTGALPLPPPRRNALDVALLRAEPLGSSPDPRAIAAGFLDALRALAAMQPVLVAIDDIQWLDPPSADAVAFAARRLEADSVWFLLARRGTDASAVERALEPDGVARLEVGPLRLTAMRRMLSERLGLALPRRVLHQVFDSTQGNPLFALEVGRTLAERGIPEIGDEIPAPERVEDLLGARVAQLPEPLRKLVLAIALSGGVGVSELTRVRDAGAVEDAVHEGLVLIDHDRARLSHPLLAAAAVAGASASERRAVHRELAAVVLERELRARHLGLATEEPDRELAAAVAEAAAAASARGARIDAVELGEHALRLTPAAAPERSERVLALAGYLETAGELQRLTDVLMPEVKSLPPGRLRARAWLHLAEGAHIRTIDDYRRHVERAVAESEGEPALHAHAVAKASTAAIAVERIAEADDAAHAVLPAARRAGADVERAVLFALGWSGALRGRPIDDLCERFRAASPATGDMVESPERVAAQRLVWRGEVRRARPVLTRLLSLADERGEAGAYAFYRLHVCELELRVGSWDAARELLDEWAESGDRDILVPPQYERCRALLAVGRGRADEAEEWAADAIRRAEAIGVQWDWLEALRARGTAALLAHGPDRAAESLGSVWQHMVREGVEEPGVFPAAPDLVEALAELGKLDEASAVTTRLRDLAEAQQHPWGRASAKRCQAIVELASGYGPQGPEVLEQAAGDYLELGLPFDRARTLLALGRSQRRHRKRAAARSALQRAATAFDEIGSPTWAEEARSELPRVGARRGRRTGELTLAERRVAELAAEGLSNQEIARTLFISRHTVEGHLSRAYAKLAIHSRAQLARALAASGRLKV